VTEPRASLEDADRNEYKMVLAVMPFPANLMEVKTRFPDPVVGMLRATDIGDERFELALREMSERDQELLRFHLGIGGGAMRTVEDVEGAFGLTRREIREIVARFMCLLRRRPSDPSPDAAGTSS
jgi:hypothetical protein